MKKILLSILAIALTVGTVSASAYALFNSTAKVSGITISSGNANLKIYDGTGVDPSNEITNRSVALKFSGLYPGFRDYGSFTFQNASASKINLGLTARLTSVGAGSNWNELKDHIYVAVGTGTKDNPSYSTSWISLNDWNTSARSLNVPALAQNDAKTYNLYVYIPADVGNEIAGKTLNDLSFEVYGTQE